METFSSLGLHLKCLTVLAAEKLSLLQLAGRSMGPGKWSHLELLGHLVDSAANNHQRFVRALAQRELDWPGYDQLAHVAVQQYSQAEQQTLLDLWRSYNLHLAFVLMNAPEAKGAATRCVIDGAPMSFSELARDYVAHLEHHLKQLLGVDALEWSGLPWPPVPGRWPA